MSRIGSMPIEIPEGVNVEVDDGKVSIKGANGQSLEFFLTSNLNCQIEHKKLFLSLKRKLKADKKLWGTYRSNINNSIIGLSKGFFVDLDIIGVGYKAKVDDKYLTLSLRYSHDVKYKIPLGIIIKSPKPNQIVVSGSDKQKVHMVASDICRVMKHDPYKGKGISIKGSYVFRKEASKKK